MECPFLLRIAFIGCRKIFYQDLIYKWHKLVAANLVRRYCMTIILWHLYNLSYHKYCAVT